MQKQQRVLIRAIVIGVILSTSGALAQSSGGSANGASGASAGGARTTGLASDQARISPPGTNSLGTANSSGTTAGGTVGANMEPDESRGVDAAIRRENERIDAKVGGICRGC